MVATPNQEDAEHAAPRRCGSGHQILFALVYRCAGPVPSLADRNVMRSARPILE